MTVDVRVPVTEYVIRQFTQGVWPLRFELEVRFASVVKVRVNAQSVSCAARGKAMNAANSHEKRAFRSVDMPTFYTPNSGAWSPPQLGHPSDLAAER